MTPAQRVGAGASLAAVVALATPLVAKWEGYRPDPYKDIVGVWTVCYGETQAPMRKYTKAECDAMLTKAVERYAKPVRACVPAETPLEVQAAFVSLAYNIGAPAFCNSTAAKRARAGNYAGACEALTWFNRAGGKYVQGLANRRAEERKLCLSGL